MPKQCWKIKLDNFTKNVPYTMLSVCFWDTNDRVKFTDKEKTPREKFGGREGRKGGRKSKLNESFRKPAFDYWFKSLKGFISGFESWRDAISYKSICKRKIVFSHLFWTYVRGNDFKIITKGEECLHFFLLSLSASAGY